MAARLSTALVNALMGVASFKDALANCVIDIYSGVQPADANAAPTGTLLVRLTNAAGTLTPEVKAVGSLTIAGASGSVDTVTVNGIDILGGVVPFNTTINQTAVDVATQINRNTKNRLFAASATGGSGVITITALNGLGSLVNTWAVSGTYTTITGGTYVDMTGGVTAINGLNLDDPVAGVLSKRLSEAWSGIAAASGTAGWFRVRQSDDSLALDANATYARYDGAIATSGGQMNLGSLTVTSGAPFTISGGSFNLPLA